ncbi:hypothetical protein ACWCP6_32035 [Streptomyces sp. NPDC002004]
MARSHRFHLDLGDHSVTVQAHWSPGEAELLVDGKVVGYQQLRGRGPGSPTVLSGELPGDPPQPLTVTLRREEGRDGAPTCVLDVDGQHRPMPELPGNRPDPTWTTRRVRDVRRLRGRLRRRLAGGGARRRVSH